MSYATQADIELHFGEAQVLIASDRDGDGVADTGLIDSALLKASEEIDSYLIMRYSLPLATTPGILKSVCCEIAMYRLSPDTSYTEEKRKRYEDAIKWLRDVAKGLVGLDDDSGTEEEGDDNLEIDDGTETTVTSRVFTRSKLGGLW